MMKHCNLVKFLALLLAFLLPVAALIATGLLTPPQYGQTFLGALAPKYARLTETEQPKLILVGGSSTAFGLDSALLAEQIGREVVNFGLYATLGTKLMLDLSRSGIRAGDIIVIAPEVERQTYSLYFNAESTWQAVEANLSMLAKIGADNRGAMLGGYWGYLGAKLGFVRTETPDPDGVYNSRNFNAYGDINYPRPYNTMLLGYDPNMTINLSPDLLDEAFIAYLNAYAADAEAAGATVYFSFPPMNAAALAAGTTDDSIYSFYDALSRALNFPVISNPHDYIYDAGYFYDTNFHLNDSGVLLRTAALAADLRRMAGDATPVSIALPTEPPERPAAEVSNSGDDAAYARFFTFAETADGLMLTGVTEDGRTQTELIIPAAIEGKAVLAIAENAFASCSNLRSLTVPASVIQFFDGALRGASSLEKLILRHTVAEGVAVGEKLFDGTSGNTKIYLTSQTAYANFVSDYFWGTCYNTRMDILS